MPTPLLNLSNRLPVTLTDSGITKSSGGLVAALEGLDPAEYAVNWLGWPGADVPRDKQPEVSQTLRDQYGCTPIFLSAEEAQAHYEGFSNSSLWPLLHYMPDRFHYRPEWWDAYRDVNGRFASRALSVARGDDDVVWVHDYQLMLVPAMLRAASPRLRIGFFLHTPFPSFEVFRCHPNREDLLVGLLGADLVGFHTFNYLRHFRSCVLRLLGIESDITTVRHDGRTTAMGVYPIGINAPRFEQEFQTPAFAEESARLAHTYQDRQVVLSVERLDYTKGIPQRLDAVERFLKDCPDVERVRFVLIAVPSREDVEEYKALREQIESRVGRLNGQYSTLHSSPIRFIYSTVTFTELCALYARADAAMVTPLIDGMNLVAKEYVACQPDSPDRPPGILILSEFAGAAEELLGAIAINPYDAAAGARAIAEALAMPPDERRRRMRPMHDRVTNFDAQAWARSFVQDLRNTSARPTAAALTADLESARAGLQAAVAARKPVALFLDYDGTLRELVRDPAAARPTPEIRALLDRLATLPNVDTTIISGRMPEDLETFLGDYDAFGLVAEHGAAIRHPRTRHWEHLDRALDLSWMDPVRRILRQFADSTPGTFVEEKRTSLVWHYRRADPEFGDWKARHLLLELSSITANAPITVRQGRKIVEVTSATINKGAAVTHLLADKPYARILIAGDDTTDETMFALPPDRPNVITVHVGDRPDTRATYRLPTPAAFRAFLASVLPK